MENSTLRKLSSYTFRLNDWFFDSSLQNAFNFDAFPEANKNFLFSSFLLENLLNFYKLWLRSISTLIFWHSFLWRVISRQHRFNFNDTCFIKSPAGFCFGKRFLNNKIYCFMKEIRNRLSLWQQDEKRLSLCLCDMSLVIRTSFWTKQRRDAHRLVIFLRPCFVFF